MNRRHILLSVCVALMLHQCGVIREISRPEAPVMAGMEGMMQKCMAKDTLHSLLISKSEAILLFNEERYEVTVSLYAVKDSILYLSAVNSGFEMIRASVKQDSIKVIDRLNKIVYATPLTRRFGYQHPVNFKDLQHIVCGYFLCYDLDKARDDMDNHLQFDFDEPLIKKRISLDRNRLLMDTFEFYHQRTNNYLMGERMEDGFRIYSNFIISDFEIIARGGTVTYNRQVEIKMDVNPRRYTFTELQ